MSRLETYNFEDRESPHSMVCSQTSNDYALTLEEKLNHYINLEPDNECPEDAASLFNLSKCEI